MQNVFQKLLNLFSHKIVLVILFLPIINGCNLCNNNKDNIRQKAREYECTSELNNIIEYYSRCYYSLPSLFSDIIDFLSEWKKQDSSTYEYYDYSGNDIADLLKSERKRLAIFRDSMFIFLPRKKIGCCVIGHPLYWIDNPELYPEYKLNYNYYPSVIDTNGKHLFNFNYDYIMSLIDSVGSDYSRVLLYKKKIYPTEIKRFFPVKAILEYYPTYDSLAFHFPAYDSIYVANSKDYTNAVITASQSIVNRVIESDYYHNVTSCVKELFDGTNYSRILIPISLYER